jgi:chromosome segregation ATPase
MNLLLIALLSCSSYSVANALESGVSPIQKVVQLLGELEMKIIKDGQAEKKAFEEFMDWCNNGAKDKEFEIKTAKSDIEDLTATIGKADSDLATSASKIEDLGASINANSADLKAASGIREKEHKEFVTTEAEMVDTIDTLERAINILERKMHGSAMLQAKINTKELQSLIHTLRTVNDAAALTLHDKHKRQGLIQNTQESDDDAWDTALGAPTAEAYKSHSESIVDVLEDLKQKAITQLDESRKEEMNAQHNFELLKQSLDDQISVDTKELSDAKTMKHEASETKATAEGDLAVTTKDLKQAESVLKNMKGDCMTKATDNEMSVKSRDEELKAIAAAKKALLENTGGAAEVTYGDAAGSFLQLDGADAQGSGLKTHTDLINFEVVNLVRSLAREQKSMQLTQLATRIAAVLRAGSAAGEDPFLKVKQLISDMIARLQKEAGEEATHKAYCDKEMGETKQKIEELKYDLEKYSSKIDKGKADSVTLKDEVATLQGELAKMARSQSEADGLRREENAAYLNAKTDLEQGLEGVRMALKILRDYYSGDASFMQQPAAPGIHKSSEAGASVIGLLEVVESDMGRALASVNMNEEAAATAYQRLSMENKVEKSMKEKDVQYKTKAAAELDKKVTELSSDRDSASAELDAVLQYTKNIRGMCELKPETYTERAGRREQEIAGLREALKILEGEAVFLQRQHHRSKSLRGLLQSHK